MSESNEIGNAQAEPVLAEIRDARRQLLEECGGSVRALGEALRRLDAEAGGTVNLSVRTARPGDDDAASAESAA